MGQRWDDTLAGAGDGAKIGGAIGSVIPIPGVGSAVGALAGGVLGGALGFFNSGSDEERALNAANMRMAKTPVSAYQGSSIKNVNEGKIEAEGAKQTDLAARGSATGPNTGANAQRAQDISKNLMFGKQLSQAMTNDQIEKAAVATRDKGIEGLGKSVDRDYAYKIAKLGQDGKGGTSGMDDLGKAFGETDNAALSEAAKKFLETTEEAPV